MAVTAQDLDPEITFISGVDTNDTVAGSSGPTYDASHPDPINYLGTSGAFKWQGGAPGTPGGTVRYAFDTASNWTGAEKSSFLGAMALWSSVADIQFAEADTQADAKLVFVRDTNSIGALTYTYNQHAALQATTLPDAVTGSEVINMDINTDLISFSQLNSFQLIGGYGPGTTLHEMGHVLGLAHAGPYNAAHASTETNADRQYGVYDTNQWTVMSYVNSSDPTTTFYSDEPYQTKWGLSADSYRLSATTPGMVDILAAQRLYGVSKNGGLAGNQVFGFHTNIAGALAPYFDFTNNTKPVVTLFSTGKNNTLDLSGFAQANTVDLRPGTFSSANGMVHNIGIALNTAIDGAVGGAGNDTFTLNGDGDTVDGGDGTNVAILQYKLTAYGHALQNGALLLRTGNATDRLTHIQTAQFADGTLTLGSDPLVDDVYYAQHNSDVFHAGVTASTHYAQDGWHEGRNPNSLFSTTAYLDANPDVAASGMDPLTHYDQFGWHEGRDPSAAFSSSLYLLRNSDVAASGMDPLAHYFEYGYMEGRHAVPVVDSSRLQGGFDPGFYVLNNPDVATSGLDPLTHWQSWGEAEGRDPDSFFSTSGYLSGNPDVAAAGVNPLDHYLQFGWAEGRNPSTHFDTNAYLAHNPDVAAAAAAGQINPLIHFLQFGIAEGRSAYGDSV